MAVTITCFCCLLFIGVLPFITRARYPYGAALSKAAGSLRKIASPLHRSNPTRSAFLQSGCSCVYLLIPCDCYDTVKVVFILWEDVQSGCRSARYLPPCEYCAVRLLAALNQLEELKIQSLRPSNSSLWTLLSRRNILRKLFIKYVSQKKPVDMARLRISKSLRNSTLHIQKFIISKCSQKLRG